MDFNAFKQIVIAECEALGIAEYELYYPLARARPYRYYPQLREGY